VGHQFALQSFEKPAMNLKTLSRRQFLTIAGTAFATVPLMLDSGRADAATNTAMRTSFKYQSKPEGEMNCTNCMHFVPGGSAKDLGGCKIMLGDTEISPQGYCIAWTKKT
jgi:hypothetical protein